MLRALNTYWQENYKPKAVPESCVDPPVPKKRKDSPDDLIFAQMKNSQSDCQDELEVYLSAKTIHRDDPAIRDGPLAWWNVSEFFIYLHLSITNILFRKYYLYSITQ